MNKELRGIFLGLTGGLLIAMTVGTAVADEWPLKGGDYYRITGIHIKDGGNWKYASWLADEWRKNEEFSKSKGWIKDFMILSNVNPRHGEPGLYLVRVFEEIPSAEEGEKREKQYEEWVEKSNEKLEAESGGRAEYREVMSDMLLQRLNFRD